MSWIKIKTKNGVLKVKPRSQLRHAERRGEVKVYDLGILIVSWWPDAFDGETQSAKIRRIAGSPPHM